MWLVYQFYNSFLPPDLTCLVLGPAVTGKYTPPVQTHVPHRLYLTYGRSACEGSMLQFIFRGLDDVRLQCMLGYSRTYLLLRQHLRKTRTVPGFYAPPPSHPAGMTTRSHEHRAESLELCGCVVMTCSAVFFLFSSPTGFGGKPYAGPFRPAIKSFSLSEDFLSPVAFSINSSQTDKSLPIGPAALYRSSYSPQVRRYLVGR